MGRAFVAASCTAALAVLLLLGWTTEQRSPERAMALMLRADAMEGRVPHTGRLVTTTFSGGRAITSEVLLVATGDGRSRLEYLSAPVRGTVVVDDGERVLRYDPAQQTLFLESPWVSSAAQRQRQLLLLLQNYVPRLMGYGRVASYTTRRLGLTNRYSGWIARRLWIHEPTGLALRWEEYGRDGRLFMRTAYKHVRFGPPPTLPVTALPRNVATANVVHNEFERVNPGAQQEAPLDFPVLSPTYLPPGFVLEAFFVGRCACQCGSLVLHQRYSDGLRSISVFQSRHPVDEGATPALSFGMLRVRHRGCSFVFLGDAEEEELLRMASSLP
ncbi:MAG: sigma-E factor regulatory protein RseB domain-containing protein [Armatimonadota bacterium]|nr:sigma-E factor regulatory protein RseB domain-containing protein [Armatimonadota bacterium]